MTTQTPQSFSSSGAGSDPAPAPEGGASARERAAQVGGTAKDQAAGVAQEARYQARDLVDEARGQVRQQLDSQKERVSILLREISDDLEQMAAGNDNNGVAADLVRQVASRARDARGYLDGDGDLLGDVRRFARRRPGTFLLGCLAAGVLAGRATRASAAARKQPAGVPSTWSGAHGTEQPYTAPPAGTYATHPADPYATQPAGGTYAAQPAGGTYAAQPAGGTYAAQPAGSYATQPVGTYAPQPGAGYPGTEPTSEYPTPASSAGQATYGREAGLREPVAYGGQQVSDDYYAEQPADYPAGTLPPERPEREERP